jgi:hypothetical protein
MEHCLLDRAAALIVEERIKLRSIVKEWRVLARRGFSGCGSFGQRSSVGSFLGFILFLFQFVDWVDLAGTSDGAPCVRGTGDFEEKACSFDVLTMSALPSLTTLTPGWKIVSSIGTGKILHLFPGSTSSIKPGWVIIDVVPVGCKWELLQLLLPQVALPLQSPCVPHVEGEESTDRRQTDTYPSTEACLLARTW